MGVFQRSAALIAVHMAVCAVAQPCTIAWSLPPAGQAPTGFIGQLITHEGALIARGLGGLAINGVPVLGLARWDGTTWTALDAGLGATAFSPVSIASFQGRIYATGLASAPFDSRNGRIWDGASWSDWPGTPSPNGFQRPGALFALPDGKLLVGGEFIRFPDTPTGAVVVRKVAYWDGSSYQMLSESQFGPTAPLSFTGNVLFDAVRFQGKTLMRILGTIATGPTFNSGVVTCPNALCTFDGGSFAPFAAPALNGPIVSMAVFNGELYVSGDFTATADNAVQLNRIARYSGGQWQKVGNGMSRRAELMRVLDDGSGDKLHIVTTGAGTTVAYNDPNSTTVDTLTFAGVVRFDGDRFTAYGAASASGYFNGPVLTLANFDPGTGTAIYFGGNNFNPGALGSTNLARRGPAPSADTDGDGLLDTWEQNGIDINCDGVIDLDLPALGAHWQRKDIFVEVDSMVGRAPSQATLDRVVAAFAAAPNALVNNPSGIDGINLHLIADPADQAIALINFPNAFADFHALKALRFGNAADRASPNAANILRAKRLVFRYCIFGNSYGNTSSGGLAEFIGDDFMVTLGLWPTPGGTPDEQAGTFMHELGHTLGLHHGGHQSDEHKHNWKPNYHSVMNYTWQVPIDVTGWTLDFSRQALPNLDENALDELAGLGGSISALTLLGPLPAVLALESGPLDFDRDGIFDTAGTVTADINRVDASYPASLDTLEGSEDWSRLVYNFRNSENYAPGASPRSTIDVDRLTAELLTRIRAIGGGGPPDCPADIAASDGTPGADGAVNNGDFQCFFANFFNALCPACGTVTTTPCSAADIAQSDGTPGPDGCVNNGDFQLFFGEFFTGCV